MNHSKTLITFLLAVVLAGCGKSSTSNHATEPQPSLPTAPSPASTAQPPAPQPSTAAPQPAANNSTNSPRQIEQANQNTIQTTPGLKDYAFMQKGEFIQKMQAERDELNQKFNQISEKITRASDSIQKVERSKVGALQTQINQLDAKLDQVNISTEANWDKAKAEAQAAYDDALQALQDESKRLDQQISPEPQA